MMSVISRVASGFVFVNGLADIFFAVVGLTAGYEHTWWTHVSEYPKTDYLHFALLYGAVRVLRCNDFQLVALSYLIEASLYLHYEYARVAVICMALAIFFQFIYSLQIEVVV